MSTNYYSTAKGNSEYTLTWSSLLKRDVAKSILKSLKSQEELTMLHGKRVQRLLESLVQSGYAGKRLEGDLTVYELTEAGKKKYAKMSKGLKLRASAFRLYCDISSYLEDTDEPSVITRSQIASLVEDISPLELGRSLNSLCVRGFLRELPQKNGEKQFRYEPLNSQMIVRVGKDDIPDGIVWTRKRGVHTLEEGGTEDV